MSLQYSVTARNAQLDALETAIGMSPLLRIYTGAAPADCAAAASGTLLAEMTLPSDWMADASSGAKAKSGTWQDLSGNAAGTAGYWRIYENTGTTCHMQGTCGAVGSGADMELNNTSIALGQEVDVNTFTITRGNA